MDANTIAALLGSVVLAFIVRFFNVVLQWLAKVLDVEQPEPIPTVDERVRDGPSA